MSAQRSLPSLFRMLGHVDAVHGAYYVFLHYWIELFGASELSTRLPSAIAVGTAAAGTAVLARSMIDARVAVVAGVAFAVLPRVTYMGAEARSMAVATAVGVWLTVLLVHLVRQRPGEARFRWKAWAGLAGYALLLAAGIYTYLYLLLLLPAHLVAVLVLRRGWASLGRWALATAGGLALALPVLYWGVKERKQISFLGRRPQVDLEDAAVHQWFGTDPLAVTAWTLVAVAVVTMFVGVGRGKPLPSTRRTMAVMLTWMLLPSVVLLAGTHLVTPMYSLRYLSFCTPAVAIVVSIGIAAIPWSVLRVGALLVVVALAVPTYLSQRSEFGKNGGSDWRQAAAALGERARVGDAVVFEHDVRPSRRPRLAMHLYPAEFEGLRDIALDKPYEQVTWLWDRVLPLADAAERLTGTDRVWLLEYDGRGDRSAGEDIRFLSRQGYSVADRHTIHRTTIVEMTK
jgi:mannosyltransferase